MVLACFLLFQCKGTNDVWRLLFVITLTNLTFSCVVER